MLDDALILCQVVSLLILTPHLAHIFFIQDDVRALDTSVTPALMVMRSFSVLLFLTLAYFIVLCKFPTPDNRHLVSHSLNKWGTLSSVMHSMTAFFVYRALQLNADHSGWLAWFWGMSALIGVVNLFGPMEIIYRKLSGANACFTSALIQGSADSPIAFVEPSLPSSPEPEPFSALLPARKFLSVIKSWLIFFINMCILLSARNAILAWPIQSSSSKLWAAIADDANADTWVQVVFITSVLSAIVLLRNPRLHDIEFATGVAVLIIGVIFHHFPSNSISIPFTSASSYRLSIASAAIGALGIALIGWQCWSIHQRSKPSFDLKTE